MNAKQVLAALAAPFGPEKVSWRAGVVKGDRGMALAYVDARDVQLRLDEVMGIDWQCEYIPMPDGTKCCRIGLLIDGQWRWRSNGAGDTQVEAEKGSYSDAFKRAAVLWGIGRYLYDLPSPWVEVIPTKSGKGSIISDRAKLGLAKALARQQQPEVVRELEVVA